MGTMSVGPSAAADGGEAVAGACAKDKSLTFSSELADVLVSLRITKPGRFERQCSWSPGDVCSPTLLRQLQDRIPQQHPGAGGIVGTNEQQHPPEHPGVTIPRGLSIIQASHIQLGAQIAKGAFGQVHAATYTPHSSSKVTTATVVVKQLLPKYAKNDMQCKVFMDEAVICQYLEDIECAGVVKFHGLVLGSDWFGIVQEMYEGSLASELGKHKLTPRQQGQVVLKAAKSLASVHAAGVLHLDVKSMNFMCRLNDPRNIQVALSDLGLSVITTDGSLTYRGGLGFGTLLWMCPELHITGQQDHGQIDDKADVFAFGVTMWEMLTGAKDFPYDDLPDSVDIGKTVQKDSLRPSIPRGWRRDWHRSLSVLMQQCWSEQPKARPSMQAVVERLQKILPDLPDR